MSAPKRFRVALSFAGEKRDYVAHVAALLAHRLGKKAVLYDKYHEAEFARINLGFHLPRLYRDESDLIVVVACPDYVEKDWTGLEWQGIHAHCVRGGQDHVLLCRFGRAELPGAFETAGFVDLDVKTPEQTASLILERLAILEGKPIDHYLMSASSEPPPAPRTTPRGEPIPTPPDFYAEPPYIGSHQFVGRRAQLEALDDWAAAANPHPVLLFEAIGGTGKSMLTWEWTNRHALKVRGDWAGRFWYSFYEKGAVMADFCRRALAYMTGQPLEDFQKQKTPELARQLLAELQARPWLLVLDGLERVLVAYHRYDAAQVADEDAGGPDQIAQRDPCAAIRPEDDDLLRALAAAGPSRLLLTTRLTPRALLNNSGQPIPGVFRQPLSGLRPPDAEDLFRACSITGDSSGIQRYLQTHCDCHPLVTGVLAGLVNDYLPDRGNFDAWAADPEGGGRLNLAELDLVQKRNHILEAALAALPEKSRALLSTLALLSEAIDGETLQALNPQLPDQPQEVEVPEAPGSQWDWFYLSDEEAEEARQRYQLALQLRSDYEKALTAWPRLPEVIRARRELIKAVGDLERRGLLQYDHVSKRYDLHPVVRGVASGGLRQEEKEQYGQRVVDHFTRKAHSPYEEAETLDDVQDGLHLVRTLLQMGRFQEAYNAYCGDLANALFINLEANAESLALIRPFFGNDWESLPTSITERAGSYIANEAALLLNRMDAYHEALSVLGAAIVADVRADEWSDLCAGLGNASVILDSLGHLAVSARCRELELQLGETLATDEDIFSVQFDQFAQHATYGNWTAAEAAWQRLNSMGRSWHRAKYRDGDAEEWYARYRFWRGDLAEEHLNHAEQLARRDRNRTTVRGILSLRGEWHLSRKEWALAVVSLREAVRMAREAQLDDPTSETQLALARLHLGELEKPRDVAEQLSNARWVSFNALAQLWLAIGDTERARQYALRAYESAWGDGEPYVERYRLNQARALLEQLGAAIPDLPPYDPANAMKLPWEDEVMAGIERLRAEKAADEAAAVELDELDDEPDLDE